MNIKNILKHKRPIAFLAVLALIIAALWLAGFRVNITASLPYGLYRINGGAPERGDLVTFCLESNNSYVAVAKERGYLGSGACPSGLRPLLKKVAGLPGDFLEITPEGICLNSRLLPGTARPQKDRFGRDLPPSLLNPGRISKGFALTLATDHSGSFDSRHFGLVPLASLQKVKPVLIKQSTDQ